MVVGPGVIDVTPPGDGEGGKPSGKNKSINDKISSLVEFHESCVHSMKSVSLPEA